MHYAVATAPLAVIILAAWAQAADKPAPPSRAELKKHERDIEKLKSGAKDRATRVVLARELIEKGKAEPSPVGKFALYEAALALACANGDAATGFSAIAAMDESHDVDALALSVDALTPLTKSAESESEVASLCEQALTTLDRCIEVLEKKHLARTVAALRAKAKALPEGDLATRVAAAIDNADARFKHREEAQAALSASIVKWCEEHLKKSIGRGECTDVAYAALRETNADESIVKGYVFGRLLSKRETAQPGDVLVLESVKARNWTSAPHHVAVIKSVEGAKLTTYHQNWNKDRTVHVFTFDLGAIVSGTYKIYRPIPARADEKK